MSQTSRSRTRNAAVAARCGGPDRRGQSPGHRAATWPDCGRADSRHQAPGHFAGRSAVAHANALSEAFRHSAERVMPAVCRIQNESRPRTGAARGQPRGGQPNQPAAAVGGGSCPRNSASSIRCSRGSSKARPAWKASTEFEQMPSMPAAELGQRRDHRSVGRHPDQQPRRRRRRQDHRQAARRPRVRRRPTSRPTRTPTSPSSGSRPAARCRLPTLGDSDTLQIGDWVLALGQPFGLQTP